MDRTEKEDLVTSLHKTFEDASIVVVTHYSGMTVGEMGDLRAQMREAGASFKVTKNRITRRALEGTKYQPLDSMFTGPTAIAYSDDPVAAAKVAVNFAKGNEKLIVLGGALGEEQLDIATIKSLASLPSMDELRAKIVGMISTPATRIAGILKAPAGQIARVISAHSAAGGQA
ncbi:MAG: 50S ribosomal protein L10 [Rhodospirillales bacterium]|nr:50S ribosomal protein L10 [Rhodospirillales bacterium]